MFRQLILVALYSALIYPMDSPVHFAMHIENGLDCLACVKINDSNNTFMLNKTFEPNECVQIDLLAQDLSIAIEYFYAGQFKYLGNIRLKRDTLPLLYHLFIGD